MASSKSMSFTAVVVIPKFPSESVVYAWKREFTPPRKIDVLDFRLFFGRDGCKGVDLSPEVTIHIIEIFKSCYITHLWAFAITNQSLMKSILFGFARLSVRAFHFSQNDNILESCLLF
jgi:hypothetical protein